MEKNKLIAAIGIALTAAFCLGFFDTEEKKPNTPKPNIDPLNPCPPDGPCPIKPRPKPSPN